MKKNMFKTVLTVTMLAIMVFCVFAVTISANQLKNRLTQRIGMASQREAVNTDSEDDNIVSENIDSGSDGFIDNSDESESSPIEPIESAVDGAVSDASDAVDDALDDTANNDDNTSMKRNIVKVIVIIVIITALAGVVAVILLKKK